MMDLVTVQDLVVHFPIRSGLVLGRQVGVVRAVDGVSFAILRGETLGLVGESGSGKTTTGRAILRLVEPTDGQVHLDGVDVRAASPSELRRLRRRMQMIFQDPYSSLNPRRNVGNIIAEPLKVHGVAGGRDLDERVAELLDLVGLPPSASGRYPHEFSGGQRQRIGLARAVALHPDLVVADEPVSALDVSIQAQILNLLLDLQSRLSLTYLFIAHDIAVVRHVADRIAVMYLGTIVELGGSHELVSQPLHPYTRSLLSAVPIPDPVVEARRERIILRGDIPSPAAPPPGCRFHTRCPYVQPERCADEVPPLRPIRTGHLAACHYAEEIAAGTLQPHAAAVV
jgi:peptide/nickel transport system ATP-binding protein